MYPKMKSKFKLVFLVLLTTSIIWHSEGRADSSNKVKTVDFGRDIRPILAEKCFPCHGADEHSREGDLRLDTEEALFGLLEDEEHYAVVKGDVEKSVVYQRLITTRKRKLMPPPKVKKPMTKEEIELIRTWIEEGADWVQHWSLVNPKVVSVPKVNNKRWPRNEIDHFILKKLENEGLKPSPEADRITLLRRVTFDLTGLPPTPKEIDDFLADNTPEAYERVVDRLLQSDQYGEHRARYWLDAARYADTHGLHLDNLRQIWPYRDWVIDAFNENKPYDEFTVEQIAGDLLPEATLEQKIATGFSRCNVTTSEGGVIPQEYQVHYTVDRVATMSTVFMGISMGCVRCHDHKFDPYTMKDFYQLYAFFNNLDGPVMDGNKPLPAPILKAPNKRNRGLLLSLEPKIEALSEKLKKCEKNAKPEFEKWLASEEKKEKHHASPQPDGLVGHWAFDRSEGNTVFSQIKDGASGELKGAVLAEGKYGKACSVQNDKYVNLGDTANFERDQAFSYGAWIKVEPGNNGGAVIARMDDRASHRGYDLYIAGDRVIAHFIHSWPNNALKVETQNKIKLKKWQHVWVTYDGTAKAAGVQIYIDGQPSKLTVRNNNLTGSIQSKTSLHIGRRTPGAPLRGLVDDVRIYNRKLNPKEVSLLATGNEIERLLSIARKDLSQEQLSLLRHHYLTNFNDSYKTLDLEYSNSLKEKKKLETDGAIATLIWRDRSKPKPATILIRGEYDKPGDPVERNTPSALPPLNLKEKSVLPTRLDLARWLVSEEHPLTARVAVNRFWQQYFGTGIVKTTEDFGSQGEQPSHPELLDWLAVDFRSEGWNVKRLHKQIVLSATYRQSAKMTPQLIEKDPNNRLLARGARFRFDAETIRDNALSLSGLLVRKIGGPSVKPYQPPGIWKAVGYTDSNTANFKRDSGQALYRRSLYTFWKRTAPPPAMVAFDAPSRENCTVRRSRTNTPLAALALMNDEQFVEASRALAQRGLTEGGTTDRAIASYIFRLATARIPQGDELKVLIDIYNHNYEKFKANEEAAKKLISVGELKLPPGHDAVKLAAWTMLSNLILNLDESITKG